LFNLTSSLTSAGISRFIREIPADVKEDVRLNNQITQPSFSDNEASNETGYSLGQMVEHPKFGVGVILNCEGDGAQARVQVNFDSVGTKWLVLAYARLTPC